MHKCIRLFISVVVVILALSLVVQTKAATGDVEIPFKYKKGDRLEVISVREVSENNVVRQRVRTHGTLDVVEANSSGYLFRWTILETSPDSDTEANIPAELLALMQSVTKNLTLEYQVTTDGTITEIINLSQTRATLSENASRVANQLEIKAETKRSAADLRRMVQFYQTIPDSALTGLLANEIAAFHAVSGHAYNERQPVTASSVMNNPFGEGFLPVTTTTTLEPVVKSPSLVRLHMSGRPDMSHFIDELSRSPTKLAQWFGSPMSNLPSPEDAKRQLQQLTITQDYEALVELSSGRRHELRSEKVVGTPGKVLKTVIEINITENRQKPDS